MHIFGFFSHTKGEGSRKEQLWNKIFHTACKRYGRHSPLTRTTKPYAAHCRITLTSCAYVHRKLCVRRSANEADAVMDLSALCEDLAFACDLLCDGQNRRIYCTDMQTVFAVCRPRAVLWAALNLLTNAVQYAEGRYIFIGTSETERFVQLSVTCEGDFPIAAFQSGLVRAGSGLWYAEKTARLHGGKLLLAQAHTQNTVALSLPRTAYPCQNIAETDFTDWLADSLSPVYTAFCEICTPRL